MNSTDQNSNEFAGNLSSPIPPYLWRSPHEQQHGEDAEGSARGDEAWKCLFHTYDEIMHAPPLRFAIQGFLPEEGITLIGGPAGHGKTFLLLSIVKSLLTGNALFGYADFDVTQRSKRVLYLIPESALGPFTHRLELFGLRDFVKDGLLFVRTLSAKEPMKSLADERLKMAAHGADLFLDTIIRFTTGDENSSSDNRAFAELLFALQGSFQIVCPPGQTNGAVWKRPKRTKTVENVERAKELKSEGLTDKDVAQALKVTDRTVRRWRDEGKLPDIVPEDVRRTTRTSPAPHAGEF